MLSFGLFIRYWDPSEKYTLSDFILTARLAGTVVERIAAALHGAGSIPKQNKCFYDLQIVAPGLAVCL